MIDRRAFPLTCIAEIDGSVVVERNPHAAVPLAVGRSPVVALTRCNTAHAHTTHRLLSVWPHALAAPPVCVSCAQTIVEVGHLLSKIGEDGGRLGTATAPLR